MPDAASMAGQSTGERDDASLVLAARSGDRRAFAALYAKHAPVVHGVLLSRVQAADAEDVTQDVFTRAWRALAGMREPGAFGAWVLAAARNRAVDLLRSRRPAPGLPADTAARREGDPLAGDEVMQAIRSLPDAYRESLVLRLVEGLTGPQIAERMGMTHGSVRVNLHRGMEMLRQKLSEGKP